MRPADGDYITSVAILTPSIIETQLPAVAPKSGGKGSAKAKASERRNKVEKEVTDTEDSELAQAQLTMDIEEAAAGAEDLGEVDEDEGDEAAE